MKHSLSLVVALLAGAVLMLVVGPYLGPGSPTAADRVTIASTVAVAAATVALAVFAAVQIWDARRQRRGVAAALLEEVNRIRTELGARPQEGQDPLMIDSRTAGVPEGRAAIVRDAVPPAVHPWFHQVVPRIAESDAEIVGLFLTLDRHLGNLGDLVQRWLAADGAAKEAREALAQWVLSNPRAVGMEAVLIRDEQQYEIERTAQHLAAVTSATSTLYRACHLTLDSLSEKLGRVLG